jgi:hypothetical protein
VLSANLHRRHLNEAQRALIATQIANMSRGVHGPLNPRKILTSMAIAI